MVAHRCKTYLVGGSFFPFLFFGGGGCGLCYVYDVNTKRKLMLNSECLERLKFSYLIVI